MGTVRLSCAALLCACAIGISAAAETTTLVSALEALRAQGANIIYSSDLVKPQMTVPEAAAGLDAWARVQQALAANGLMLQSIGPDRYIVTQVPRRTPPREVADTTPTDPAPIEPVEVSVYASRYELSRDGLGEPRMLTGTDIEVVPGTRDDALRAVRMIPGLATNGSTRPYIRGSFVDDVLVQFDGVPLADPFHLKNFQSLISAFDPQAVERIEVYSGGFPVRYGTKSGGVIDVEPRAVDEGYENALGVSLLAYDASSVGHSERWPLDWLVTLRHSVSDVVLKPVNASDGEPKFSDSLGRLRWQTDAGGAYTLGWLLLDDSIDFSSGSLDELAEGHYRDEYMWLAYDGVHGDRWRSRTVLAGAWAERSRTGDFDAPGIADEQLDESRHFSSAEMRTHWTYRPSPRRSWDLGFETTHAHADLRYDRLGGFSDAVAAAFQRPADNTFHSSAAPEVTTYAFSVSARQRWTSLEAELGMRVDAQDYDQTGFRHQWSPRLNVRYDVSSVWRVYGSWGRFTQAQRVDELRTEEGQVRPDSSALAVHAVVGVAYDDPGAWRVGIEVYRKRWTEVRPYFDNFIDTLSLLPDLQPDRVRIAPIEAEAAGVEVSVRRQFGRAFEAWGGFAASRVLDDVGGASDVPRSWDQPQALNGGVAWNDGPWRASALLAWHKGWPRTQVVQFGGPSGPLFEIGPRNRARWDNYFTLDMNAAWTRPVGGGDLTLWADLTNAANRDNECCAHLVAAPLPGEEPAIEGDSWLPRTLNVGVTWRLRRVP